MPNQSTITEVIYKVGHPPMLLLTIAGPQVH